jgi:hypothetical protein
VLFTDAYAIPFWLVAPQPEEAAPARLFEDESERPSGSWSPNLSDAALSYLESIGVGDAQTSRESATLIWLHSLAIGYSPLYASENGVAVRADWPRIPLPDTEDGLRESARLGATVARLVELASPVSGVDRTPTAHMQTVAAIERLDGSAVNPTAGDLAVTVGWGIVQPRAVMPGAGRYDERDRIEAESAGLSDEDRELLGDQILDVYLNERTRWRSVPAAAWDFKIGGFQVLRKWLSYREQRVLGRDLTIGEARVFTTIARRLTALSLLGAKLDSNYIAVTDSPHQEQLFT